MKFETGSRKSKCHSIPYNVRSEHDIHVGAKIDKPEIVSKNFELMSMMEYELNRFHCRSKKEMAVIFILSCEVFLRHRRSEPELIKLVISIYLYFIDYLHYLGIEKRFLFPVILDTIPKSNYLGGIDSGRKGKIQEKIRNIQQEQYYAMGKLRSLRKLTRNYLTPVNACEYRRLLFSKMRKFDNALVKYLKFQYIRIFPSLMGG